MPFSCDLQQQSLHALEWDALLAFLAREAESPLGVERCTNLLLAKTIDDANARLQETTEMCVLIESERPFPSVGFTDLRSALTRLEKGGAWEGHEFRDLSVLLGMLQRVQHCLMYHQAQAPRLLRYLEKVEDVSGLQAAIDQSIDLDGNLLDSATPVLFEAIQEVQRVRGRLRHRVEHMLSASRFQDVLQEQFFATREGRYVLPVKAEFQSRIPGIVHDVSASGATVFLEPKELIDLNNHLKVAEIQVAREVQRILHALSTHVSHHTAALQDILHVLGALDCISARAKLSRKLEGHPVRLNSQGHIQLRKARHPLLVLGKDQVVANDIDLPETQKVLIISGPNTGGKTVNLKLLGIFALMVRGGIHLSCSPNSEMGFFTNVYADIGDAQDLTKDLSSFSAHILNLIGLLTFGTQDSPLKDHTLVLVDEIVGSTDPNEGTALAIALLHELKKLGFKVVVTTHYHALKTLALTHSGFTNASLEFDVQTLSPTYHLVQGFPGGSSALEIAGRLGMDPMILDHAKTFLETENRQLEDVFRDLQESQLQLRKELEEVTEQRMQAEKANHDAQEISSHLRAHEQQERQRIKKQFIDELTKARLEIRHVVETLQTEKTIPAGKNAGQQLYQIQQKTFQKIPASQDSIPLDQLHEGNYVDIGDLGVSGVLLESPQGKKRVRVRTGNSEMTVPVSLLVGRHDQPPHPSKSQASSTGHITTPPSLVLGSRTDVSPTYSLSVDIRGHTVEEGLVKITKALDQASLHGTCSLCVIHGHGTGRLKAAVRDFLSSSSYINQFRPGEKGEGGDGVTIVEMAN
ncbi:MAG: endonuclease MutS2 [Nitrospirae bacterium]|nr:endonuclease MutS2 [Nitrospirota bacterium]